MSRKSAPLPLVASVVVALTQTDCNSLNLFGRAETIVDVTGYEDLSLAMENVTGTGLDGVVSLP